jgi:hypothetical protein
MAGDKSSHPRAPKLVVLRAGASGSAGGRDRGGTRGAWNIGSAVDARPLPLVARLTNLGPNLTGARVAGSVLSYIVWLLGPRRVDDAAFGFAPAGRRLFARFIEGWPFMLAGGALATAGYGIAIWARTVAPIALVAALRETGVRRLPRRGISPVAHLGGRASRRRRTPDPPSVAQNCQTPLPRR